MTHQPPDPGAQPASFPSGSDGDPAVPKSADKRRSKLPWIVGGAAVGLLLLATGAAFAYEAFREDSGVAACKAIRDQQGSSSSDGGSDDMTEGEYRETRKLFADSKHEDIRDHGTKLVDVLWQVQQLPEGDEAAGFAFIGQLAEHASGLQSACADQGVMFNLLGGEASPHPSDSAGVDPFGEDASPGAAPAPSEGSAATEAGKSYAWPDGISIHLDKVEIVDRSLGYEIPRSRSLVRVTFTFRNSTSKAVPLQASTSWVQLLYGPNRTEGESAAGYSSDDPKRQLSNQDEPTRIAAGGEVRLWRTYSVPSQELGELAIKADAPQADDSLGYREPYTFTEVETLLVKK